MHPQCKWYASPTHIKILNYILWWGKISTIKWGSFQLTHTTGAVKPKSIET